MDALGAQLEAAFSGAALVATRNGVPVLPIGISGSEKISGITWLLRRPEITVNIGSPFYLTRTDGKVSRAELGTFTHSIMERIAELLPPEYRGKYNGQRSSNYES